MKNRMKGMLFLMLGILVFQLNVRAQQKEVIIEKKAKKPYDIKSDSLNYKKDAKSENVTIVINGDKVTINGKASDLNDPRIKMIKKLPNKNTLSITDSVEDEDPMIVEDMMDMAPPPPPQNKAFLGVLTETVDNGVKVIEVVSESPAAKANMKENDIIISVNEVAIENPKALFDVIGKYNPSDKVKITYIREGKKNTIDVTLEKNRNTSNVQAFRFGPGQEFKMSPMPNGSIRGFNFKMPNMPNMEGIARSNNKPKIGISVEDIEEGKGVKVKDVKKDSPAEKAGLHVGDIITNWNHKEINEVNDIKWSRFEAGQSVSIEVTRGKEKKTFEIKIPKKINSAEL